MALYLLKRLLLMVPTFVGITALTFALLQAAPGDAASAAGLGIPRVITAPSKPDDAVSFVTAYAQWLRRSAQLDFGISQRDARPVQTKLFEALPATATLGFLALLVAYGLGIPLGVWGAVRPRQVATRVVFGGLLALYSLPSFWVALLSLWFFATPHGIALFPLQGWDSPLHWVLPVGCLMYGSLSRISRHVRAAMSEALHQPFVQAALARGVPYGRIVSHHALKHALLPALVLLGSTVPALLGGSVIIERVFGIAGLGSLALEAVLGRDYPVVMGVTTFGALLTMFTLLVVDIAHTAMDPRVRT